MHMELKKINKKNNELQWKLDSIVKDPTLKKFMKVVRLKKKLSGTRWQIDRKLRSLIYEFNRKKK